MTDERESRGGGTRREPLDWHRILSGALALGWLALYIAVGNVNAFLQSLIPIAASVACIWFADELASWEVVSGLVTNRILKAGPPAGLVRAFGWVALVAWTVGMAFAFWMIAPGPR